MTLRYINSLLTLTLTLRGPPYAGATFGQPVRMPVVSQAVEQMGFFHSGWPGPVSQNAVIGNYGGFWGDVAASSFQPPGFDYNQIASRPVGRPVIPVAPGEQHLGHGQYMDPEAVARPDVKPRVSHDTRPKTTDFAGQTAVAWTEAGSRAVSSGHGASERSSNAKEVGHVLSGNLRPADPPRTVSDCPQARIDAPFRSTPVQSPMFYQEMPIMVCMHLRAMPAAYSLYTLGGASIGTAAGPSDSWI